MTETHSYFNDYTQPYLLYDKLPADYSEHRFAPFALTDAFIKEAGEKKQPILHFWQTDPLIILGMMDTKLPFLSDALTAFASGGYDYLVRNSGGLAVVSDGGVLNFSMIFPEGEERLSIDEAYSRMHQVVQTAFSRYNKTVDAYEIADSYCPGEFDLSIEGRKIAGIAQRRIRGGIAVMIYLSVSGDQTHRAEMIREFYTKGLDGTETRWSFPAVNPNVMTTLEDALGVSLTIEETKQHLLSVFTQAGVTLVQGDMTASIASAYDEGLQKMITRNDKLLP